MNRSKPLGGVVHTYQRYDPVRFPSPTQPPPDVVTPVFEHLLLYGGLKELTEEDLARAVPIDPSQIRGWGPSIDALLAMLLARKRKILATYQTDSALDAAARSARDASDRLDPPRKFRQRIERAAREEQIRDLEQIWYQLGDDRSELARGLVRLIDRLGDKYQVEELAARYTFTGTTPMDVPQALAVKKELEQIDQLIEQLQQAAETGQIGVIDRDALATFADAGDLAAFDALAEQIREYLRDLAERQGIDVGRGPFQLSPRAQRLFQGKLLERIFSQLQASRTGRHMGPVVGEGAVETPATRDYAFGDSITHMDIPASLVNAMIRNGPGLPIRLDARDIQIHATRNTPKCATCVLMDMSGSMRYNGQYMAVKRMGLALEGLLRREFPGDVIEFLEIFSFARPCPVGQLIELMPKPVTIYDPIVRLVADMSRPDITEMDVPPHFTNIQHGLALARRMLARQDTPNRQVILITDGLPTAHFEGEKLYLLYPPDPRTEAATLREAHQCHREGITINIFLLPCWSQSEADIRFAYRMAESTAGRVFFTAGKDLDRYVLWDYLARRREMIC